MAGGLPVVCVFGAKGLKLLSEQKVPEFETNEFDCRYYDHDEQLQRILSEDRPNVIVTVGKGASSFPNLMRAPFDVRKKWIHFPDVSDPVRMGNATFYCYLHNALGRKKDKIPLVSVFTPAFKTGDKIGRPFRSLMEQQYVNWEWVIVDDSDDNGETFAMLCELADRDTRIRVYRHQHSGFIGATKHEACMLCRGDYLIELDHDDELTDIACGCVAHAFEQYPEAGFVYTDFAECFEGDRGQFRYPDGWGHGYGSYRTEVYKGTNYSVVNAPNINPKTIRHIVASPNHIRAWRKSFYVEVGGHSRDIHVADDYELMVRTFLNTRMVRVPAFCYIQFRNKEGNTHMVRNKEIQRLVRHFSQWYDKQIHERFLELGVDDFLYQEGEPSFWRSGKVGIPDVEPHCTLIARV